IGPYFLTLTHRREGKACLAATLCLRTFLREYFNVADLRAAADLADGVFSIAAINDGRQLGWYVFDDEEVVASAAADGIQAFAGKEMIDAGIAKQHVIVTAVGDRVAVVNLMFGSPRAFVARADPVIAVIAVNDVVAAFAGHAVIADAAPDEVVAVAAGDGVVGGIAEDLVVAAHAVDEIFSGIAVN